MIGGPYAICAVSADLSAQADADAYDEALEELEVQLTGECCADLFSRAPSIEAALLEAGGDAFRIPDVRIRRAAIALQDAAEECARDEAKRQMANWKPHRRAA